MEPSEGHCTECGAEITNGVTVELWTEQEVSDRFRIPLGTLRYWRHKKTVLPFRKLGSLVRYVPDEVRAVISAAKVPVGPA